MRENQSGDSRANWKCCGGSLLRIKRKKREKKWNNKDALHSKSLMWSVFASKSKDNNWRPAEVNASDILFVCVCVCVCVCMCTRDKQLFSEVKGIQNFIHTKKTISNFLGSNLPPKDT